MIEDKFVVIPKVRCEDCKHMVMRIGQITIECSIDKKDMPTSYYINPEYDDYGHREHIKNCKDFKKK